MNNDNISDLGKKLIGFWTRKRLDIYAVLIKGYAWTQFYYCNYTMWRGKVDKADLMKLAFKRRFQHFFPWGMEDYQLVLLRTEAKRVEILKSKASPLCHYCYGRGRRGFNENTLSFVVCNCVKKRRQAEMLEAYNNKWYRKASRWIKGLFVR